MSLHTFSIFHSEWFNWSEMNRNDGNLRAQFALYALSFDMHHVDSTSYASIFGAPNSSKFAHKIFADVFNSDGSKFPTTTSFQQEDKCDHIVAIWRTSEKPLVCVVLPRIPAQRCNFYSYASVCECPYLVRNFQSARSSSLCVEIGGCGPML